MELKTYIKDFVFNIFLTVKYNKQFITIRWKKNHHPCISELYNVKFNSSGHCTIDNEKLFNFWKSLIIKNLVKLDDGYIMWHGYICQYNINYSWVDKIKIIWNNFMK